MFFDIMETFAISVIWPNHLPIEIIILRCQKNFYAQVLANKYLDMVFCGHSEVTLLVLHESFVRWLHTGISQASSTSYSLRGTRRSCARKWLADFLVLTFVTALLTVHLLGLFLMVMMCWLIIYVIPGGSFKYLLARVNLKIILGVKHFGTLCHRIWKGFNIFQWHRVIYYRQGSTVLSRSRITGEASLFMNLELELASYSVLDTFHFLHRD